MESLKAFIQFQVWFLLLALSGIVAYQLVTGKIHTKGLLSEKDNTGRLSPGRTQLLLSTIAGAIYYILSIDPEMNSLPAPPDEILAVLAGSNLVYLGEKFYSLVIKGITKQKEVTR
jgi:hypothetical protein